MRTRTLFYTLNANLMLKLINLGIDTETDVFRPHGIARLRVPTRPAKPGKMRVHLENLEISWNFEKLNKYHGKMM